VPHHPPAPPVFGWREHVALPEWGIPKLRAKLDTGARTSALHVEDYEELAPVDPAGRPSVDAVPTSAWSLEAGGADVSALDPTLPIVRFHVLTGPRDRPRRVEVVTSVVAHSLVRDTRARPEERPVIRTRIVCGPMDTVADVSLTDRSGMNFRMLLGRTALAGHALVDPAEGFHVTDPPRRTRARAEHRS
jgi:hypothetical protein